MGNEDWCFVSVWRLENISNEKSKNYSKLASAIARCITAYQYAKGIENRTMFRFNSKSSKQLSLRKIFGGDNFRYSQSSRSWENIARSCINTEVIGNYYYEDSWGPLEPIDDGGYFWLFGFSSNDSYFDEIEDFISKWLDGPPISTFDVPAIDDVSEVYLRCFDTETQTKLLNRADRMDSTIIQEINGFLSRAAATKSEPFNEFSHFQLKECVATYDLMFTLQNQSEFPGLSSVHIIHSFLTAQRKQLAAKYISAAIGDEHKNSSYKELKNQTCGTNSFTLIVLSASKCYNGSNLPTNPNDFNVSNELGQLFQNPKDDILRLFHGTTISAATSILTNGVDVNELNQYCDFGKAFYTTPSLQYALYYPIKNGCKEAPALMVFEIPRKDLEQWDICHLQDDDWRTYVKCCRKQSMESLPRELHERVSTRVLRGPITQNAEKIEAGFPPIASDFEQYAFKLMPGIEQFILPADYCTTVVRISGHTNSPGKSKRRQRKK